MANEREAGEVTAATVGAVVQSLLARGASTRADLTTDTGLSRPTVSRTLAVLLRDGAIEQVKDERHSGRGRPPHLVRLSSRRADTLGVELGRRHVAFAVTDVSGQVVLSATRDTGTVGSLVEHAREALAFVMTQTTESRVDLGKLRNIVVGTPGPRYRNQENHAVDVSLARLSRERALVAEIFMNELRAPVMVGNNTRFTALAELDRRRAAGLRVDDLIYLRVDEGIGGGVVTGGELQGGAWDAAGEMGHVSVDVNGPQCFCGGRGCLELVAGLPAVIRAADANDLDDLRHRAENDDSRAAAAIAAAGTATGGVLAGVLAVVNPSVVVIGGSVASLPGFLERVEAVARSVAPRWATLDLVVESAATDHVLGAIGAAAAGSAELDGAVPLLNREGQLVWVSQQLASSSR